MLWSYRKNPTVNGDWAGRGCTRGLLGSSFSETPCAKFKKLITVIFSRFDKHPKTNAESMDNDTRCGLELGDWDGVDIAKPMDKRQWKRRKVSKRQVVTSHGRSLQINPQSSPA